MKNGTVSCLNSQCGWLFVTIITSSLWSPKHFWKKLSGATKEPFLSPAHYGALWNIHYHSFTWCICYQLHPFRWKKKNLIVSVIVQRYITLQCPFTRTASVFLSRIDDFFKRAKKDCCVFKPIWNANGYEKMVCLSGASRVSRLGTFTGGCLNLWKTSHICKSVFFFTH